MTKLNLVAEPNSHALHLTRDFDAPRELVFKAHTDPNLIPKWWGVANLKVDKMDVRKGGIWRFTEVDGDGNEYAFNGVYHDIVSPERIVYTFEFEGMPGHVLLETITFEEHDGKTTVTDSSVFQTIEGRDGMLQSGMEDGARTSWERLEALLKTL